jgi:hypothetical protein
MISPTPQNVPYENIVGNNGESIPVLPCIHVLAAVLVLSTVAAFPMAPENALAYEKNQAVSQASACGNEFVPINTGCQNTDSQIQGDENAAILTAQQTFPEVKPTPPPKKATLPDEIELVEGVSPDCEGVIEAGQELTCAITNSLDIVPSPTTLTVCRDGGLSGDTFSTRSRYVPNRCS